MVVTHCPHHGFIGEVAPLQLAAWPRWGRKEDLELAQVMAATQVAPLVAEEGLAVLEVSSDSEAECIELIVLD